MSAEGDDPKHWPNCSLDEMVWLCIPELRGQSVHLSDEERAERTRYLAASFDQVNRELDEIAYCQKYPEEPWTEEDVEYIKECLRGAMYFIRLHILELMQEGDATDDGDESEANTGDLP